MIWPIPLKSVGKNGATLPLLLIVVLFLAACTKPSTEDHEEHDEHGEQDQVVEESHEEGVVELSSEMMDHITILTAAPAVRVLPAVLLTTGQVDFEQDRLAHVTPRIPGRVEEVRVDLGDKIEKGQVLAMIDSIDLGQAKSSYLQARAQEELALQNFKREEGLFTERISSEKEMFVAKAAHLEATARLRNSEETLRLYGLREDQIRALSYEEGQKSLLSVRSPLSGRVVEKHVTVGELVTPERTMFTVADLGHVWVWIDVYERDLRQAHLEDDVEVSVDAYPDELFRGKVSYLSDQVDVDSRTVRARIDVINPEHKLRPGMFARVTLTDPHFESLDTRPSIVVPASAVQRDGQEFVVFAALGDNRFERREVEVGRRAGGFVEILSGIAPDDVVVVEGTFLIKSEASKEQMGAGHEH